ncbi:MAG TPA: hypothetical protein VJM50_01530 [Pyrinomonadaceae bacterium]|nr:hypothetical protein [Pyrinomonadaceae bacterium]
MSKTVWNRYFFGLALITTLMLLVWIAGVNAGAQTATTGEWTANISSKDNSKINLNFERRSNKGHKNQMGQSYEFSELQGLSREQALSGGPVSFSLVREAGRIDCEGTFQNGKGSGTFRFTGNAAFVSAMKSRGFDFESRSGNDDTDHWENKLFAATTLNVTTALADDLTSAFGKLQTDDLFKAAIFKVNSTFAREMKASGFENLDMEDLVKARIFKVDADFVRQVSQMGFNKEPFESLVKMQIFKVTPEFINEVRNEGLTNVAVEELVKLRIFKIDGEFIRKVKSEGGSVDVESLVQRKIFARR